MQRTDRKIAAAMSISVVALNVFYASQHGLAPTLTEAWLLTALSAIGAGLVWFAAIRGPWLLAWVGFFAMAVPPATAWPWIFLSLGGMIAVGILLVAFGAIAAASPRRLHRAD